MLEPVELANPNEEIIDEAVIDLNCWMMHGGKKPGKEPYIESRRYHYTVRDSNEASEGSIFNLVLAGHGEERPKTEYAEILSIRNKFDELRVPGDKFYTIKSPPSFVEDVIDTLSRAAFDVIQHVF